MAYAKLLRSPHAHALIKRIDTVRARALPGVYAVITGHDLPRVKFGILPVSQDEEALCVDKVRMVGDAVAAVAAVDEETAERAARLIDVEYEPLKPLMSIQESLANPDVRIHEYGDGPNIHKAVALQFGDVESAFSGSHLVREDVFFFEGTPTCPWSSTRRWRTGDPTASSPCGRPRRRRTTSIASSARSSTCRRRISGWWRRRWAADSAASSTRSPTRSRRASSPSSRAGP
jgi:CO/xanthine dehydrogenase Mo-binding subunit